MKRPSLSRLLIENSKYAKTAPGEMKKPGFDDIHTPDNHTTGKHDKEVVAKGLGSKPKDKKVSQIAGPKKTSPRNESILVPQKPAQPKIAKGGQPARPTKIRREPIPRHQHNPADPGKPGKLMPNNMMSVPVQTVHEELAELADLVGPMDIRADMLEGAEGKIVNDSRSAQKHGRFDRRMKENATGGAVAGGAVADQTASEAASTAANVAAATAGMPKGTGKIAATAGTLAAVSEAWDEADWSMVIDMMKDSLGDERDPNQVMHAAEAAANEFYDELGFPSPSRAISPIMQKWDDTVTAQEEGEW